jgi:hypothetical protein
MLDRGADVASDRPAHLTEEERAVRAVVLGVVLGAILALLARRR